MYIRKYKFIMLSSMVKKHRVKQQEVKQLQEKRKQEAVTALYRFNEGVMSSINNGVSNAYVNQCQIDAEMKHIQTQATRFNKLTSLWATQLNEFYTAMKELGDVQNWASGIENDLKAVVDSLEYIHQKEPSTATPSTS